MSSIMREYPTTVTKEQAMNVIRNHGYDTVDISDFLFVGMRRYTACRLYATGWVIRINQTITPIEGMSYVNTIQKLLCRYR